MLTAAEILDALPEFAESEGKEMFLELAEADQADLWGDVRYQFAIAYRAAHQMEGAGFGVTGVTGSGEVTSKRIGSLSVSYATPTSASGPSSGSSLDSTRYGRLLQELLAGAVVPMVVGECWGLYGRDWGNAQDGPWGNAPFSWRNFRP